MARFLGSVQGSRGPAVTRLGTPNSGTVVESRGWNGGLRIASATLGDTDTFDVRVTGGSNDTGALAYVGSLLVDNKTGEITWVDDSSHGGNRRYTVRAAR